LLKFSSLEKLRQLEEEAIEKVRQANAELVAARELVNRRKADNDDEPNDSESYNPSQTKKNDITNAMVGSSQEYPLGQDVPSSIRHRRSVESNKWQKAQEIASDMYGEGTTEQTKSSRGPCKACFKAGNLSKWHVPILDRGMFSGTDIGVPLKHAGSILEHPTYAVITFTSRQAAVAARQCLVDGSGVDRWVEIEEVRTDTCRTIDGFSNSLILYPMLCCHYGVDLQASGCTIGGRGTLGHFPVSWVL
jgi:hypothetical protein